MARSRAGNPSAPPKKERRRMRLNNGAAMKVDEFGDDPWAMARCDEVFPEESDAIEATITKVEPEEEEEIAQPTPIAQHAWKVIAPDGREEITYQPIPGFEHLWNGPSLSPITRSPNTAPMPAPHCQATTSQVPVTGISRQKTLKRSRSHARRLSQHAAAQNSSDDDDEDDNNDEQCDDREARVATEKSYTFYIGDVVELKKFFRRRLEELTMKPLRPIVTAWIKQLEPKRLSHYGPYHKKLPKEQPPASTPPWWPHDVPYEEPSHLDKNGLLILAVDVMLQHRQIDEAKRRGSWVSKLRQAAEYAVKTTAPDQFSSSKGSGFSEMMQGRALSEILPSLFEIAHNYEDHFAQYNLYEGTGSTDSGKGKHVTWHPLTKPPRQVSAPSRKRARQAKVVPIARVEYDAEASGDETEVDDILAASYLRRARQTQGQAQMSQSRNSHASREDAPEPPTVAAPQAASRKRSPQASRQNSPVSAVTPSYQPSRQHVPEPPTPAISQRALQYGIPEPPTPAAPQYAPYPRSSVPTPHTSFDGSMHSLHLDEKMDVDAKAPYYGQGISHNVYTFNQPMQYPASHAGYSQMSEPHQTGGSFSNPGPSTFGPGPAPGFEHSFSIFDTPYYPQVGNASFATSMGPNASLSYGYQGMYPTASTPVPMDGFFHGLPANNTNSHEAYHL